MKTETIIHMDGTTGELIEWVADEVENYEGAKVLVDYGFAEVEELWDLEDILIADGEVD